jgi:hypothetical protein
MGFSSSQYSLNSTPSNSTTEVILTPGTRETDESKIGLKQIGSPEEKGRKKLPTIIKYAGQGKDVYLCGKKQNLHRKLGQLAPSFGIILAYLETTV